VLHDIFSSIEKRPVRSEFAAATIDSLEQLLALKPTILHLHCYVVYDDDSGELKLALENSVHPGLL
jgi:hypothetical protein